MKITSEQEMMKLGLATAIDIKANGNYHTVIELIGDVGAGKTTFVRGLAKGLGILEAITSPSYTISKVYAFTDPAGQERFLDHYDFYRLGDPGLMVDNLTESIRRGHLVVIEWGDTVTDILPSDRIRVTIKINDDDSREAKK